MDQTSSHNHLSPNMHKHLFNNKNNSNLDQNQMNNFLSMVIKLRDFKARFGEEQRYIRPSDKAKVFSIVLSSL